MSEKIRIPFSRPALFGNEEIYIKEAITHHQLAGDGPFTKKCQTWLESLTGTKKAFLTTSGTHALEMVALLMDIKERDEIIMPSYTFSSTANAFALRGAHIVFVDIRPDTMNIDEKLIEPAITKRTKAIVPVHYAGVGCEMASIMEIAHRHDLFVVEDAAQGMMSTYAGSFLGTIGHFGAYSFHETKNYTCGEGGVALINKVDHIERAEIIREKGTNRSQFFRGETDKYTWQDVGSSWLPSELNAAFLFAQIEMAEEVNRDRLKIWSLYKNELHDLQEKGCVELPCIPDECRHNAHIFHIKTRNLDERTLLIDYLRTEGIYAVFHYVPLHASKAGRQFGSFCGEDKFTTKESERLLRLPLYYKMSEADTLFVCQKIKRFFKR